MKELHVLGPPGTGKTSWLSRQVELAAEKYGPHRVMVSSFTKAAVVELNQRKLPIPEKQLGTLHALAYRALDCPEICETGKHLKEFNDEHPNYAVAGATRDDLDDGLSGSNGSNYLQEYSRCRSLRRSRELWPETLRDFSTIWEGWKSENSFFDFTDLIETALREDVLPPGLPDVGFFDEAQDFTPLELALVRQWGSKMDTTILVYDEDQTLYRFKGADPKGLVDTPIPRENILQLKQSYRVPRAVQAYAQKIITEIPATHRHVKEYYPREEEGSVARLEASYKQPHLLIEQAMKHVEKYQTTLILASCGYMLDPVIAFCRQQGIPFSNPYRRKRRDWNPLLKVKDKTSAGERVAAFVAGWERGRQWTDIETDQWIALTKGLKRWQEALPESLRLEDGLTWLQSHLNATWGRRAEFAIQVARRDWLGLHEEPALFLGTIHSLKGGEADVVMLLPDLSPEGYQEWSGRGGPESRHNVIRQFYVGVTRAREALYLCNPVSQRSIRWW